MSVYDLSNPWLPALPSTWTTNSLRACSAGNGGNMKRWMGSRVCAALLVLVVSVTSLEEVAAADTGAWPTKAALLAAARAGQFSGLPEVRFDVERETAPLTNSVLHILRQEYGVPTYATGSSAGSTNCMTAAAGNVRRLLTLMTAANIDTLSPRLPTFTREVNTAAQQENIRLESREAGGGWCASKVMGKDKPHPYGAALLQLADEFNQATREYVEAERERRRSAYAQEQEKQQAAQQTQSDAKAKQDADSRAAERQRIEAERARIEADDKRRRQQDKNRVAG